MINNDKKRAKVRKLRLCVKKEGRKKRVRTARWDERENANEKKGQDKKEKDDVTFFLNLWRWGQRR